MDPVTVDIEKLSADLEAAIRDEDRLVAESVTLQARLDEATQRREELEKVLELLRSYFITPEGAEPHAAIPRPFAGETGAAAASKFVAANPGAVMKVERIFEEMRAQGFGGTINAIQVAFANMAKAGEVERVKRGTYQFPSNSGDEGDFDAAKFERRIVAKSLKPPYAWAAGGS